MFFSKKKAMPEIVYNPMGVQAVFFKQASNLRVDGRILVNSSQHDLDRTIVSFSIIDSCMYDYRGITSPIPLTPGLLSVIFAQAKDAGFTPLSLLSYGKLDIHTGVLKDSKERFTSFKKLSLDPGSESVGKVTVHDPRSSVPYSLDLRIPELVDTQILFTPELFHYVFECIRAEGMTPHTLLSFQTQEPEDYRPYYERMGSETEPAYDTTVTTLSSSAKVSDTFVMPGVHDNSKRLVVLSTQEGSAVTFSATAQTDTERPAVIRRRATMGQNG